MIGRWIAGLSLVGWLMVAGLVVQHAAALTGTTTLRWTNLTRPTPAISWGAIPETESGRVIISAGHEPGFRVRLPRGFVSGTVSVQADQTIPAGLSLTAEALPTAQSPASTIQGSVLQLSVDWRSLVARGHDFVFTLHNPSDQPVKLSAITITLQR